MEFAEAQSIEAGPLKVDTGNDWLDFLFIVLLVAIFSVIIKKIRK